MSPTPLIELQRRLAEAGRIRLGEKGPKGEPRRLTHWRLTSPDKGLIEQAAVLYGGDPAPWESPTGAQWQIYTETAELPVLVLVNYSLRQSYEHRTSPTLVERRCDGTEMEDGRPCLCAAEGEDKCDLITRLTVALPELTTLLGWRLESKGENAARELLGSLELVQGVAQGRPFVPAKLRIVERRGNVNGQAVRYVVPVLDCHVSYQALAMSSRPALEAGSNGPEGYLPIPPRLMAAVGLKEALGAAPAPPARTSRSAAPIPEADDLVFADEPVPVPDETLPSNGQPDSEIASADQQKLLMARAREHGWSDAARYDLTENVCGEGIRSVKKVPKDKVDEMLAALERGQLQSPTNEQLIGQLGAYGDALSIRQQVDAAISQHPDDREWLQRQVVRLKERYEQAQAAL